MAPPVESSKTRNASTPLVGVVVAGGASSRFGSDKALAVLDGETLVERAHRALREVCDEVIVADAGRGILAGVESVPDGPGHGPIAAVLGAARRRPGRALLVLACDLPRVPVALLRRIVHESGDWVVPRHAGGPRAAVRALPPAGARGARGQRPAGRARAAPPRPVGHRGAHARRRLDGRPGRSARALRQRQHARRPASPPHPGVVTTTPVLVTSSAPRTARVAARP